MFLLWFLEHNKKHTALQITINTYKITFNSQSVVLGSSKSSSKIDFHGKSSRSIDPGRGFFEKSTIQMDEKGVVLGSFWRNPRIVGFVGEMKNTNLGGV
jgi:hypothetical protein